MLLLLLEEDVGGGSTAGVPDLAPWEDDDEDVTGGFGDGLRLRRTPPPLMFSGRSGGLRARFSAFLLFLDEGDALPSRFFGDIGGLCGGEFGGRSGGLDDPPMRDGRPDGGGDEACVLRAMLASTMWAIVEEVAVDAEEEDGESMALRLED